MDIMTVLLYHVDSVKLTMKVAACAISGPQVSVMISRVSALDSISIPLFTNIMRGMVSISNLG